jgi:hypothetical protein
MQNISKQRIHKFKQIKKNCKRLEQKSVQKLFLFNKEKNKQKTSSRIRIQKVKTKEKKKQTTKTHKIHELPNKSPPKKKPEIILMTTKYWNEVELFGMKWNNLQLK